MTERQLCLGVRSLLHLFQAIVVTMADFVQITTTTGDRSIAEQIAADLVDRRLVACAQIVGPVRSVYRWNGAVEFTEELLLTLKTRATHVEAIKIVIAHLHPYDMPELIVTPISDGSEAYLNWLREQTQSE